MAVSLRLDLISKTAAPGIDPSTKARREHTTLEESAQQDDARARWGRLEAELAAARAQADKATAEPLEDHTRPR